MLKLIANYLKQNKKANIHQLAELCHNDYDWATMLVLRWENQGKIKRHSRLLPTHCSSRCDQCNCIDFEEFHWTE